MKTNRNVFLLAFVAFVLSLILTSCAGAEHETTAEVRVVGTAAESASRSVSASAEFASAEIILDDRNITNDLKPESGTSGSTNDVEFQADVPVLGNTVSYSVEPNPGFVFDEWEFSRDARSRIRTEHGQNWMNVMREIMRAIAGDPETIEINPDYIKYIRPTFDRGAYFDAEYDTDPDLPIGTKANPISNTEDFASFISKYSDGRFDNDELTIKFTASSHIDSLDLSQLRNHGYWDDDEIEIELKLIGGYGSKWNYSDGRTFVKEITLPALSNFEEIEIEFRNIHFENLDYSKLVRGYRSDDDDREFNFRNCSVGTLTNAGMAINGLIIDTMSEDSGNTTFINSVAPYVAGNTYIHSIITEYTDGAIKGVNNIVVYVGEDKPSSDDEVNIYISESEYKSFNNGYKTSNQSLIAKLTTATALDETDHSHRFG